ncbi:helix-turn-helix transcriptional regulator [Streptomyces sp. NRRL F-2664]|uniref:helix-turn-helix transcriptional regulator n=1 Tax=Streptomyces sp. NRRL F-2664 TaxID=1463842 RepID=UPI00099886F9|nr:LuxR family transcriptional regulator [Streptomyces sp. NRRL F-2664]
MLPFRRAEEMSSWKALLDGCAEGKGGLLLVEGAVGCGKSEFLEAAAAHAEDRGALVLRAAGSAAGRGRRLEVLRRLAADAPGGALPLPQPADDAEGPLVLRDFTVAVRALSTTAPVVVCVDDLHHVDAPSGRHLLHLAGETRRAPVLLALAASPHEPDTDPHLRTELLRLPHFVRLRLGRLTQDAVRTLLPDRTGAEAALLHEASGGNPLLLRALLQDPGARPGDAYAQAVLTCLHRCGPATAHLGAALAVLDGPPAPAHLARLSGADESTVVRALAALEDAGLLAADGPPGPRAQDGRAGGGGQQGLRHPAARAAVLDRLAPAARSALHTEAAQLARASGAPDTEVAGHLLAARDIRPEWSLAVLRAAAEQHLAQGDPDRATALLRLAHEACPDEATRAEVDIRLGVVLARTDPAAAEQHLAAPLAAAAAGRLGPPALAPLARALAAQGRIDESADVLERLAADDSRPDGTRHGRLPAGDPLDGLSAFPRWAAGHRGTPTESAGNPAVGAAGTAGHPAALWALPAEAEEACAARSAELFLRGAALAEGTVEAVAQALRTLLHLDGAGRALPWCEEFARQAARRGAPGWLAVFAGLAAEARLRLGDLTGAVETARGALRAAPARGTSAQLGAVAGTLARALTASGRLDEAAAVLARPVPTGTAAGVHVLAHLRARGHHALATNRFHAALGDFLDIGRHSRRWGLDRPRVLPWRTDAAEALLRLGETRQAERFLADQLTTRDAADPWVRGTSLRLRAALREPRERQAVLARAVDELQRSGDAYELARAMADFGQALREAGEPARAALVQRKAWHLAKNCGADALRERILPGHTECPPGERGGAQGPDAALVASLSESERRVALLAVHGHTNREIAGKLYITVSTVEQHLTRVYRKLNIPGRQSLPVDLDPSATAAP